jgi:WD40 repeat protein
MTFPDHQNIVYSVAVKADGSAGFSVGADRQLRTWKAAGDGKQIKATGGHGDEVFKVVSHPTKPMLLTSSADKSIRSWDAEKLSSVKTFQGLNDFAYALAVSPDGTLVAGGSYAGEVTIWKIDDAAVVKSFNASPGYVAKAAKPTK